LRRLGDPGVGVLFQGRTAGRGRGRAVHPPAHDQAAGEGVRRLRRRQGRPRRAAPDARPGLSGTASRPGAERAVQGAGRAPGRTRRGRPRPPRPARAVASRPPRRSCAGVRRTPPTMHLLPIVALALCLAVSPAAQTHTHGGAVGPLDRDSVVFWTRTSDVADVSVRYGLLPDLGDAVETQPVRTAESSDFTAKVTVDGLRADATYYWQTRVAAPDNPMHFELSPIGSFRTPPDPETRRVVRIAFSGDVD